MVLFEDKAWVRTCERNERKKGTRVLPLYPLVPPTDDDRRCIIPPWLCLHAIQLRAPTCRPLPVEYLLALVEKQTAAYCPQKLPPYWHVFNNALTWLHLSLPCVPDWVKLSVSYTTPSLRYSLFSFALLSMLLYMLRSWGRSEIQYQLSFRCSFFRIADFLKIIVIKTSEFSYELSHNRPSTSLFSSSVIFLPNSFFSIFLCTFYSKARSVSELGHGVTLSRKGRIFRLFSSLSGRKKRLNRALLVKSYGWCKIRRIWNS